VAGSVAYELDADEQSRAAHVADERTRIAQRARAREEMRARSPGMPLQLFVLQKVQDGQSDRASASIAQRMDTRRTGP
jgi:hypothetical protein